MKFDDIKKLNEKKFREKFGHFVIEGEHLVQELERAATKDARLRESKIFVTRDYAHWSSQLPMHVIQSKQMAQISETRTPQGIAAVVPLLEAAAPREGERAVYLHEIQDPGNFGTILRTLAWFGNFRCLCSADSVDLHNGKVVRASMGAIFHVPVEFDVPMAKLSKRYPRIACLDLHGQSIASPAFREFDCYMFGNEARGLPHEQMSALGAKTFTIPGTGAIESLNVASSVNICLYELNRAWPIVTVPAR
jgi:TrmH family RNA methyltransferase